MPRHRGGRKQPPKESEQSTNTDRQALEARGPIQLTFEYETMMELLCWKGNK
jgi:hypothetical protein